mmetsp:Transcript_17355/g.29185  ORF Transcript_17355/g.29185 Transcript_17355/m.29185 type:complete len:94 (-) Transcript_17355:127-408(-)|eukprot:CAMPEP_0168615566 /NCGR_PEP_ID=MMETSP0449_2-20121227/4570_1 /TAXON_ID=1082188 /ORGANISM="Strombidium rassoulzadegani, Strain ras09" /LENGTH=93 /DNA_ID=CAMNT_0008656309 /DNA_START=252 /DNA_END=533 /DNA_ORIENTATION=-
MEVRKFDEDFIFIKKKETRSPSATSTKEKSLSLSPNNKGQHLRFWRNKKTVQVKESNHLLSQKGQNKRDLAKSMAERDRMHSNVLSDPEKDDQ